MSFRARQMQPKDVRECAEIIAAHPVIGARYGPAISDLRVAWLQLLRSKAKTATVFEKLEESRARLCFVGVSVFVSDDFIRELKTPPLCWFGPNLAKRIARGDSPLLSEKQFADANTRGGLNLLVWEGCFHPEFKNDIELPRAVMDTFVAHHRGFQLKELISSELESAERLEWTLRSGSLFWDPENGHYTESMRSSPEEAVRRPHRVGLTRELELSRRPWSASWVGTLFDYHPPRCGFSPSEQRLLLLALSGEAGTDQELADALDISLPRVKKLWLSVYRRVSDCVPELIQDRSQLRAGPSERGKEKKRHLLAYLREHAEELRPVSRKLLRTFK